MARESRLMLEVVVGPRTQESATELVEGAARRLARGCWPLWSSDGWEPYLFALTVVFAVLIHFIKGKGRGRPKDSQVAPDPRVRYGQVIKQRAGRRLVAVTRRVVFGVEELIPLKQISTSLLERLNGTIRQHVAPLHRKTRSFAKCRTALDTQTQLFKSYYNLCRKHGALKGQTPAQAAGLSDRRWSLREFNRIVAKSGRARKGFLLSQAMSSGLWRYLWRLTSRCAGLSLGRPSNLKATCSLLP